MREQVQKGQVHQDQASEVWRRLADFPFEIEDSK